MVVDLMILTDDKDELKRYVPSLAAAFEYVNPKMTIERKPTSHYDREKVPTARKLLFLLTGNQGRAADMVKRWLKYLYTVRNAQSKYFAVTVDDQHTTVGSGLETREATGVSSSINVIHVDSIDHVELWVPQFIHTFFEVPIHHGSMYSVRNLSTEYVLAKETETHVQNLLTKLGFCKSTLNDTKCTFIIVRSGFKHDQRKVDELQELTKAAADTNIPVLCISTQHTSTCSYTDIIQSPIYGRPDIVTCVVLAMISLGLINRSWTCWSYCIKLYTSYKVNVVHAVRIPIAIIIIAMHVFYTLSLIPFLFIGVGAWNWSMSIRDDDLFRETIDVTVYMLTNVFATILSIGLLWGLGCPAYGHIHYMKFVIGTVAIICFYIIWYSFVHVYIFYKKLGYKHGVFDLPYVLWD